MQSHSHDDIQEQCVLIHMAIYSSVAHTYSVMVVHSQNKNGSLKGKVKTDKIKMNVQMQLKCDNLVL